MKKFYGTCFTKTWRLILSTLFLMLCCGFMANSQPIVINGNPADWGTVFRTLPPGVLSTFVVDLKRPDGTDNQFTQGAKDFSEANEMAWSYSQVGDKVEITNAGVIIWKAPNGDELMYFMGDRLSTNGTAEIGFWVFQNGTAPDVSTMAFKPIKQIGDILILFTFTNGGRVPNLEVYEWLGTAGRTGVDRLRMLTGLTDDKAIAIVSNPSVDPSATGKRYPVPTYNDPVFGNWVACNKEKKDCGFYYDGSFVEGMLNLTKLGLKINLCHATFLMETRQSHSLTSMLSDFVGGSIGSTPKIWAQDAIFCLPEVGRKAEVTLCALPNDPDLTFKWYSDEGLTNKVGDGRCLTVSLDKSATYYVTATNSFGCTSDKVMVKAKGYSLSCELDVNPEPVFGVNLGKGTVKVTVHGDVVISDLVLSYNWGSVDPGNKSNISFKIPVQGATVTVTDQNGCTTTCTYGGSQGCESFTVALACNPAHLPAEGMVKADVERLYNAKFGGTFVASDISKDSDPQNSGCFWEQVWGYTITDPLGNISSGCKIKYTWKIDIVAPVITDISDYTLEACNADWPAKLTTSWTDNCQAGGNIDSDGGVNIESQDPCYQLRVYTFKVKDECGNEDTETVTVKRKWDKTAPVMEPLKDLVFACNDPVIIPTPVFNDNCDGPIDTYTCEVVGYPEAECATFEFPVGETTVCFTAYDECGNSTVECIKITVEPCTITCQTAYARLENSTGGSLGTCFIPQFSNWGWTNPILEPGKYELPLYAGAAQCNPANGWGPVGKVLVDYAGTVMKVTYLINMGYSMSDVHVYVGCGMYPKLRSGRETISPGQYTHVVMVDRASEYTVTFTNVQGPVWVIAHAVVCNVKGKTTGSGTYAKAIDCRRRSATIEGLAATDLRVYPNPFSTKVNFEFVSGRDAQARLEIYNGIGQKITTLMDRAIESGVLNRIEYQPQDVISGVLFYRLTIGDDVINGKLLYNK